MTGLLNNLRAIASIPSLPQVDLPNFELLDSETERLTKALDVQWNSPRKQLAIMHSSDAGVTWHKIGAIAMFRSAYPFTTHDLMNWLTPDTAREYPEGSAVGVRLEDVGTGLLGAGDTVIIDGSYIEEFTLTEPVSSIGAITVPDLQTVEGAIITLTNAIAAQGSALNAIVAQIGDIDTPGDISAQLTDIMEAIELGNTRRSETTTEQRLTVSTTNTQLIAADTVGLRMSVIIVHAGDSGSLYVRTGTEAATSTAWIAKLEPGELLELETGEAVQGLASAGSIPVNVTEVS
jgi:hypothetical protein